MQKILIIGTMHLGFISEEEMHNVLQDINPDQLLLELPKNEVQREAAKKHSDEMALAERWAQENNVEIGYFDTGDSVLKEGVDDSSLENKALINEELTEARKFSWQKLNQQGIWQSGALGEVSSKVDDALVDKKKYVQREWKMLENIKRLMTSNGTILILTGAGHLDFFEANFPEAEIVFRKRPTSKLDPTASSQDEETT